MLAFGISEFIKLSVQAQNDMDAVSISNDNRNNKTIIKTPHGDASISLSRLAPNYATLWFYCPVAYIYEVYDLRHLFINSHFTP